MRSANVKRPRLVCLEMLPKLRPRGAMPANSFDPAALLRAGHTHVGYKDNYRDY